MTLVWPTVFLTRFLRAKLKTLYSETAADRLMGFYCRGVGIGEHIQSRSIAVPSSVACSQGTSAYAMSLRACCPVADDRGHLYVLPRHRQDSMLFIHGDLLRRCQSVPAAPEPPVVISSTKWDRFFMLMTPSTEAYTMLCCTEVRRG